ncbi:hypothetical protein M3Y95_00755000 [Aphelenchoides besseyi]|nr:hypothetical protein M3Y95_00755000 [Aphelenchoides besseyi]
MSMCLIEPLIKSEKWSTSDETFKVPLKSLTSALQCRQFQRDACYLIHESKKSLDELASLLSSIWEKQYYVGEEVYRKDGSGKVYTVVKKVFSGNNQYLIRDNSMVTESVRFSDLLCTHQNCVADMKILIELLAAQQTDGRWLVASHHCRRVGIKDKLSHDQSQVYDYRRARFVEFLVGGFLLLFLICMLGYSAWKDYLLAKDNARLSRESIALVAEMNRTTLNNFFKELVANETINAVDHPLAAEGIAHMFRFESNLKNRTTLDEYVDRMKPTQQSIFYAYDHLKSEIEQMSTVQSLVKAGNEVLFVTNPLDKRVIDRIDMFKGKWFVDVKRVILNKNETAILNSGL